MKTKLTLRLDEELIGAAKEAATARGVSLSQMVENFFAGLLRRHRKGLDLGPVTSELYGRLAGAKVDEKDYRRHLEAKYR
jgi:hypothetical protein